MECGACAVNCAFGAISVNTGVGCAAAISHGKLHGTEPSCGCGGFREGLLRVRFGDMGTLPKAGSLREVQLWIFSSRVCSSPPHISHSTDHPTRSHSAR